MGDTPDFEALRKTRNEAVQKMVDEVAVEMGWKPGEVAHNFDLNSCYCDCPNGPCEHNFTGWREFEDGSGGEQVCSRCGTGAMSHSLRTGL